VTTNPPFLSYYLAPVAALLGSNEILLHLAMLPFLFLLGISVVSLAKRFTSYSVIPMLLVLTSPGILTSMNLMRDVPAVALSTAALAAFIAGSDRKRADFLALASILAGLATLTKYSAAIVFPLLILYLVLKRRPRQLPWLLPGILVFFLWWMHSWILYGEPHPYYLAFGEHPTVPRPLIEKLLAGIVSLGSLLFLQPIVLMLARGKNRLIATVTGLLVPATVLGAFWYNDFDMPGQYAIWLCAGAILIAFWGAASIRATKDYFQKKADEFDRDRVFIVLWFLAPILFSLLFAPFQAVRHILPALAPFAILVFQASPSGSKAISKHLITLCLVLQVAFSIAVQIADYQYAEVYRDFAAKAQEAWGQEGDDIWFVGHWGWQFYASEAGFKQLHGDGTFPSEGDILVWPERVYTGQVFAGEKAFVESLEEIKTVEYPGKLPLRTLNFQGAAFYAVLRTNVPYNFQRLYLERFRVYRVGPSTD
jgi:hypothetical protein